MQPQGLLGIDIGGTKTQGIVLDREGKILAQTRVETHTTAGAAGIEATIEAVMAALPAFRYRSVGIGIAGSVDATKLTFLGGAHFSALKKPLKLAPLIQRYTKAPLSIINDAQAFALGEALVGAGKGKAAVVGVTIGTGIGGGIVRDGQLVRGAHGTAGEFGHMTIALESNVACACGGHGHLEAFVSGTTARTRYAALTGVPLAKISILPIEREAAAERQPAAALWKEMQHALAAGFAAIILAHDPDVIVIGGGVAKATSLWQGARALLPEYLPRNVTKLPKITLAKLGDTAPAIGAALAAAGEHHIKTRF